MKKEDTESCWYDHCTEICERAYTKDCPLPKLTKCDHEHRVCDSHKRTMAIQLTDKVFEVMFDTFVLSAILTKLMPLEAAVLDSLSVAVIIEGFCFAVGYFNLRLWNKVNWGRIVREIPNKKKRKT